MPKLFDSNEFPDYFPKELKGQISFIQKMCGKTNRRFVVCVCDICKKEYSIRDDKFKRAKFQKVCKTCSYKKNGKLRIDSFKKVAEDWFLSQGSKLLSEYNGNNTWVEYECVSCRDKVYHHNFNRLRFEKGALFCRKCNDILRREKFKNKDVPEWFLSKGSKLLTEYLNGRHSIEFICSSCKGIGEYYSYSGLRKNNSQCLCRKCILDKLSLSISGSKNYSWRSDLSEKDRIASGRRSNFPGATKWKTFQRRHFNNVCFLTKVSSKTHAHHIYSWERFPNLKTLLWNGVLIAEEIHYAFHRQYSKKRNTFPQFQKFCKENFGLDFYISLNKSVVFDILETWDEGLIESRRVSAEAKGLKYFCFLERYVLKHPERVNYAILSESGRLDLLEKPFHFKKKHLRELL